MKKLTLFVCMLFLGSIGLQAQKLVPEKPNPSFGSFDYGDTPEVVMKFTNTDTKPIIITEYYPKWLDEQYEKDKDKNGPQPVITIAPGQVWILKFRIDTQIFGPGKHVQDYRIMTNETGRGGADIPFSFEVGKRPPREGEEGEGPKGPGGRGK